MIAAQEMALCAVMVGALVPLLLQITTVERGRGFRCPEVTGAALPSSAALLIGKCRKFLLFPLDSDTV